MSEKEFVSGMFVKKQPTKYGDIIKVSIEVDSFAASINSKIKPYNNKKYVNIDILENKEGKIYAAFDNFVPDANKATNKETPSYQEPSKQIKEDDLPF